MITLFIILMGIMGFYALLVLLMSFSLPKNTLHLDDIQEFTVLIAARNEEANILNTLKALKNQKVSPVSIILVDDHSEDSTLGISKNFVVENPEMNIMIFSSVSVGKKAAWKKALAMAKTERVLSLDADCVVDKNWTKSILDALGKNKRLISAPVLYAENGNALYRSELLYLVAGGAAAIGMGFPFQVSGAGLMFYKDDYLDFEKSNIGEKVSHGDDVFFLQYIIEKYGRNAVGQASEPFSVVRTIVPEKFSEFFAQRIRWSSKARSYLSVLPFLFGAIVFFVNAVFLMSIILYLKYFDPIWLIPAMIKIPLDILLPFLASVRWKYRASPFGQLLLSVIYPLYMLMIFLSLIFGSKKRWKGRQA